MKNICIFGVPNGKISKGFYPNDIKTK